MVGACAISEGVSGNPRNPPKTAPEVISSYQMYWLCCLYTMLKAAKLQRRVRSIDIYYIALTSLQPFLGCHLNLTMHIINIYKVKFQQQKVVKQEMMVIIRENPYLAL